MNHLYIATALLLFASVSSAEAKDYSDANSESVACYQNGQLILKTQERIREFQPTSAMTLLADVSVGQVLDTNSRLYASDRAGVVCVVTNRK
jgi:hypothetical protein